MQKIELEIEDDEVVDKVLWMLKHFELDGVKLKYEKRKMVGGLSINILRCKEMVDGINRGDFTGILTIDSLQEHFRELGI